MGEIIKGDVFEKHLSCDLTEEELSKCSKELARDSIELRETEESKKEVVSDFAAKTKGLESGISRNSRKVSTGMEWRNVDCQWLFDFSAGYKRLIRTDTGEELEALVKVSDNDRQAMLPLAKEEEQAEEIG